MPMGAMGLRGGALSLLVPLALAVAIAQETGQPAIPNLPAPPPVPAVSAEPSAPRPLATPVQIPNLPLGVVTFPNGKAINLTVAMGSAAFRHPADPPGRIWLLTDRGPSIACEEARRIIGLEADQLCGGDRAGRIYPLPGFVPSIYGIDIGPDNVGRINAFTSFKGKSGRPVSGRPNPATGPVKPEGAYGIDGKAIPPDPSGIDPEGFVRLADGTFWLAEEYGPSLLEVAPDGAIRRRLVPSGAAADFKDADYDIVPVLPALARLRVTGRGFEALAVSPDERFLYTAMQGPLANPDAETARASRNVRLWKIERESGQVVGQYFYELDPPAAFRTDNETRDRQQAQVGITEIVALGEDRLLVLERIEKTARLFVVKLDESAMIPPAFDLPETRPTFEQVDSAGAQARGLVPLTKTLALDTDAVPGLPARIEAVAVVAPDEIIVVNDNDFAVDGVRMQMFRVTLPQPVLQ